MFSLLHVRKNSPCLLCAGPRRKSYFFVCVILLFYSETELLHNTAKKVGMRMGLIGTKKGVSFWFLLYVTNIIVLLKKHRIFFPRLVLLDSYRVAHERTP